MNTDTKHADGRSMAERRHQTKRIKAKRSKYVVAHFAQDERKLGLLFATPASCSCRMCGNQRRHAKGKERLTRQELRADTAS